MDFGKAVRFFQFGYRAYQPRFAELRYDYLDARGGPLRGTCRTFQESVPLDPDLVALLSTGRGLMLLRQGRLHQLFDSMGYIFGMTVLNGRIYFLHLIQVEGNYKHSEETYRRSEIYSLPLDEVLQVADGSKLRPRREHSERGVLYSYCNAHDGKIYSIDYLGRLSVFEPDGEGRLSRDRVRHVMMNRHLSGAPLRHYAYTHFNAVSVTGQKIYIGAHGRKAHSGQFSAVFSIPVELDPSEISFTPTPFVHAHDAVVANGHFYVCDSRNGALVRDGERLYVNKSGFMRGLSVMENRLLVGVSQKAERRADRNRNTKGGNLLALLQDDGRPIAEARIDGAQIYRTLVLSEPDFTVSSLSSATAPDFESLMAHSTARSVESYYGDDAPPFDKRRFLL